MSKTEMAEQVGKDGSPKQGKPIAVQEAEAGGSRRENVLRLVALVAIFAAFGLVVWFLWPYIGMLFEEDGRQQLINWVQNAGPLGVLALLGLQCLQVVVAFIPGEVVQAAAGIMFGTWGGALIVFVGATISSYMVYFLVHKLGAPFVKSMVPEKYMNKLQDFEKSGKMVLTIFILFLIPGMPKDVFTYIFALSDLSPHVFVGVSCVARIPGIILSTFAASSLVGGHIIRGIVVLVVFGIVAIIGIVFRDKVMDFAAKLGSK